MSSMVPPGLWVTPASPVVVEQITRLNDKADRLDNLARSAIEDLLSVQVAGADLDPRLSYTDEELEALLAQLGDLPEFDPNTNWLEGLDLSAGNENFVFNPELMQYLGEMLPEFVLPPLGSMPPEPEAPPAPGEPGEIPPPVRPTLVEYEAPDVDLDIAPPVFEDVTSAIPMPVLRPIVLPTLPDINVDDILFEGVTPVFDGTPPDPSDFAFENTNYEGLLLDETKAVILRVFNGETGLPPSVEQALFERAREREVELAERDVEQVRDEWAARGWKMAPAQMQAATNRARRDASAKVSQLNRDQFIENHKERLAMLRDAMTNAMALEDLWTKLFMSAEDRRLQAAKMRLDLALQVFNALVSKYQADAQLLSVQAQVFSQKFQAAQMKLSLYSEQLRAQSLIGDLNEQDIRIFAQQVGALEANARVYSAKVEGYRALFDAINAKVAVYRAQLESNQTLLTGYETDMRGFVEMMRAQAQRDERFRIRADIYGKNMDAWRTRFDVLAAEQNQNFKRADLQRDVYNANTQRVQAFVAGESARINALRDKYASLASEIQSKSEVERSRYQLMLSIAEAKITRYEKAANILLQNGQLNIQNLLTAESLMLRGKETGAQVLAQMAAGYTSAANVNASISDSSGSSLSYSFQGEIDVN